MKNLTLNQAPPITDTFERTMRWDGLPSVRVHSTHPVRSEAIDAMPQVRFILANGLIEEGGVLRPWAHNLVAEGLTRGVAMTIYRHGLPMTGPASYDPHIKSRIFSDVVKYSSEKNSHAIGVIAHSQGCGDVTMLSVEHLVEAGYMDHLTSVSPAGHCVGKDYTTADVFSLLGRVLGEAAACTAEPGAYRTLGAFALNGVRHIGMGLIPVKSKNGKWVAPAIEEAKAILRSNYVEQVAALSRTPDVSVFVMPGENDSITGSNTMEDELRHAGYEGAFRVSAPRKSYRAGYRAPLCGYGSRRNICRTSGPGAAVTVC